MVSLMEQLIVLLPKPSAVLSMIGSYGLIRELFADQFYRRRGHHGTGNKVIPRALFTLSMADLFHSFAWFLTTWPSPKELSSYVWLASGNTATCTFQGFLVQFGFLWSLGSNCILFLWYLLILRYNWPNSRLCKMEPWVHVVVFLAVFWSSAVPLFYGMYNNWFAICYIVEYPLGCRGNDCIRGKYAWIVNDLFGMIPVWGTVGFSVLTMSLIFCSVRRLERRNAQYAGSRSTHQMSMSTYYNNYETSYTANSTLDSQQRDSLQQQRGQDQDDVQRINREKSRAVAAQGYCYFAAFIATYVLDLVGKIIMWTSQKYIWNLNLVSLAIIPLQGFFNFLVFCRTRKDMKTPEGKLLRSLLCCSTCFPCLRSTFLHWLGSSRTSNDSSDNNNNNNNSNINERRNTSSKKTPPTSNGASLHRPRGGLLTAPGAPVVVQVGAAKDQQQQRPAARISESVEIAFEPDSQFERPNRSAISNLTPTTATTRSDRRIINHYPASGVSSGASEVIVFSPDSQFEAASSTAAATVSVAAATAASTALPPTTSEAEEADDVGLGEATVAKPERDDAEGSANNPAAAVSDTTSSTSTTSANSSRSQHQQEQQQQEQQQNPLSFLQPRPPSSPLLMARENNNNDDHDDSNDNNRNNDNDDDDDNDNDNHNDDHDDNDDNSSTRSSSQRRASF